MIYYVQFDFIIQCKLMYILCMSITDFSVKEKILSSFLSNTSKTSKENNDIAVFIFILLKQNILLKQPIRCLAVKLWKCKFVQLRTGAHMNITKSYQINFWLAKVWVFYAFSFLAPFWISYIWFLNWTYVMFISSGAE